MILVCACLSFFIVCGFFWFGVCFSSFQSFQRHLHLFAVDPLTRPERCCESVVGKTT